MKLKYIFLLILIQCISIQSYSQIKLDSLIINSDSITLFSMSKFYIHRDTLIFTRNISSKKNRVHIIDPYNKRFSFRRRITKPLEISLNSFKIQEFNDTSIISLVYDIEIVNSREKRENLFKDEGGFIISIEKYHENIFKVIYRSNSGTSKIIFEEKNKSRSSS